MVVSLMEGSTPSEQWNSSDGDTSFSDDYVEHTAYKMKQTNLHTLATKLLSRKTLAGPDNRA